MIKTKTKIDIILDPIKKDTISVNLCGDIIRPMWGRGYNSMNIEYIYFYEHEGEEVIVKEGVYQLSRDQINKLASVINHDAGNKCDSEKLLHFSAFRILMAQNYSILTDDIEII